MLISPVQYVGTVQSQEVNLLYRDTPQGQHISPKIELILPATPALP